jgi:AP-4 complex subunit beta-1
MLQDNDANVITNVIHVLSELLIAKGGIKITQTMILTLLNRISEFSEWGLNTVLDLIARYTPESEEEMFSIMNLLDPVLRTASSAAVIGTFKCFMKFSVTYPELQPQVYQRSKPPILTLITSGNPEVQYAVLKHLQLMLQRKASQHVFNDEYRQFYVRYNEPAYIKHLKVDILPYLASEANARDIANELNEYVTDVDAELSKRAIASIAEIGMRIPSVTSDMTTQLVSLIDLDMPYVRNESMKRIANILRIYPHGRAIIIPLLSRCLKRVDDSEAKASLIWMLGEYGKEVMESPYLIETMIDNYEEENEILIKLHLLSASMKLFFKRPPEMQAMLGRLLKCAVNDTSHQDVHDRALLYYRLLSSNPNASASVFASFEESKSEAGIKGFAELGDVDKLNHIFDEFNTLAVIYDMPSQKFIEKNYQFSYKISHIEDYDPASAVVSTQTPAMSTSTATSAMLPSIATPGTGNPVASPIMSSYQDNNVNLLDMDDNSAATTSIPAVATSPQALPLKASLDLSPQQYQSLWLSLPDQFNGRLCCLASIPRSTGEIETILRQSYVSEVLFASL